MGQRVTLTVGGRPPKSSVHVVDGAADIDRVIDQIAENAHRNELPRPTGCGASSNWRRSGSSPAKLQRAPRPQDERSKPRSGSVREPHAGGRRGGLDGAIRSAGGAGRVRETSLANLERLTARGRWPSEPLCPARPRPGRSGGDRRPHHGIGGGCCRAPSRTRGVRRCPYQTARQGSRPLTHWCFSRPRHRCNAGAFVRDGRKSIGVRLCHCSRLWLAKKRKTCPGARGLNAGDRSSSKRPE